MKIKGIKVLKVAGIVLFCLLWMLNAILLYLGLASPLTTLTFYLSLGWFSWKCFAWLIRKHPNENRKHNARLLIRSLVLVLLVVEFSLRFLFQLNLTYQEANGGFFYFSPYRSVRFENLMRRYYLGQEDLSLRLNPPGKQKMYDKPDFSYLHRYNSKGLRDQDWETDKPAATLRILAAGDSFTEGVGAPGDSTWPQLLQNQLQAQIKHRKVELMNFGISGSDLVFETAKIEKIGLKYNPDWVIMALNRSDIDDMLVRGGRERFQGGKGLAYRSAPAGESLYAFSYLYRLLVHSLGERNSLGLSPEEMKKASSEALTVIAEELEYLRKLCKRQGVRLLVVFHPTKREAEQGQLLLRPVFESFKEDSNTCRIDILQRWQEQENLAAVQSLYWPIDLHHTPSGYALLANTLAYELLRLGIGDQ